MAIPTIEKREEYVGYAEHCVRLARQINDSESRRILREMGAEWLRLVDKADHLPLRTSLISFDPDQGDRFR